MRQITTTDEDEIKPKKRIFIIKKPLKFNKGILIPTDEQKQVIQEAEEEMSLKNRPIRRSQPQRGIGIGLAR